MDSCDNNSLSYSSDNKRNWDLFYHSIDCNPSVTENKKPCTVWSPWFGTAPLPDQLFPSFSSAERSDRPVHDPRATNISFPNCLDFSSLSTSDWCNRPEGIGTVEQSASYSTDVSWFGSNFTSAEVEFEQNPGYATVVADPAAFQYPANQKQIDFPLGTIFDTLWFGSEDQQAAQSIPVPHDHNETSLLPGTLAFPSISIGDLTTDELSALESSVVPSIGVSQSSSGSKLSTHSVDLQENTFSKKAERGIDSGYCFDVSSGSYPSFNVQSDSQRSTAQDTSELNPSNLALENADVADYLNANHGSQQINSPQTALVSGSLETSYDTCFGMVRD